MGQKGEKIIQERWSIGSGFVGINSDPVDSKKEFDEHCLRGIIISTNLSRSKELHNFIVLKRCLENFILVVREKQDRIMAKVPDSDESVTKEIRLIRIMEATKKVA